MPKIKPAEQRVAEINERIAQLQQRKQTVLVRAKEIERRIERAEAFRRRKEETRAKIITGALIMAAVEREPAIREMIVSLLSRITTNARDRELLAKLNLVKTHAMKVTHQV